MGARIAFKGLDQRGMLKDVAQLCAITVEFVVTQIKSSETRNMGKVEFDWHGRQSVETRHTCPTSSDLNSRLTSGDMSEGLTTDSELGVECCYALQDKVWANDPDGAEWEWYTVLADSDVMIPQLEPIKSSSCC